MNEYLNILNKAKQRDLTADEKKSIRDAFSNLFADHDKTDNDSSEYEDFSQEAPSENYPIEYSTSVTEEMNTSKKEEELDSKPIEVDYLASITEEINTSESEVELELEQNRGKRFTACNKNNDQIWWSIPSPVEQYRATRRRNKRKTAAASCSETFANKADAFKRIMSPSIVNAIVIETNKKAKQMQAKSQRTGDFTDALKWRDTTLDEVYAYIAILIYAGAGFCYSVSSADLFHVSHMAFYRAVMSRRRFEQITKYLRFDDSRTRASQHEDKLAPFRNVWNIFQTNLGACYRPSKELSIGEQLLPIRGSCCFRQKIPKKREKYGIKIIWIVDSDTHYPLAGEIFLGTQLDQEQKNTYQKLIYRLIQPYLDKGYNISMNKVFTTIRMALKLIDRKTSIVGAIGKNEPELPIELTTARRKESDSSIFCFSGPMTLVSYVNANKKNILLLSTTHADKAIDQSTFQPEIFLDYSSKKFKFDQMLRTFTCTRKNNRWTMILFFNMIDAATLCSHRLCDNTRADGLREKRKFYESLSLELATPHILRRIKKSKLRKSVKIAMQSLGFEIPTNYVLPEIKRNSTVYNCVSCYKDRTVTKLDLRTTYKCDICLTPTCFNHYIRVCGYCNDEKQSDSEEDSEEEGSVKSSDSTSSHSKPPKICI